MDSLQSQTQRGPKVFKAGADLRGKENCLAKLNSSGAVILGAATDTVAQYVLIDGGNTGEYVTVAPITGERNYRVKATAAIVAGSLVEPTASGEIQTKASAATIGWCEEGAGIGELALVRLK